MGSRTLRVMSGLALPMAAALLVAACGGSSGGSAGGGGGGGGGAASATASANGVEKLTVDQIMTKAKEALKSAKSVHLTGTVDTTGQSIGLNLKLSQSGDSDGTLKIGTGSVQIIKIGQTAYVKGDDAFWQQFAGNAPGIVTLLHGKYIKTSSTDSNFQQVVSFSDIGTLSDNLLPSAGGKTTKGAPTTYQGQRVLPLVPSGGQGNYYIALDGPPYPVALVGGDTSTKVDLHFSDYDQALQISAPPADQVIDQSMLKGLGGAGTSS